MYAKQWMSQADAFIYMLYHMKHRDSCQANRFIHKISSICHGGNDKNYYDGYMRIKLACNYKEDETALHLTSHIKDADLKKATLIHCAELVAQPHEYLASDCDHLKFIAAGLSLDPEVTEQILHFALIGAIAYKIDSLHLV